MHVEKIATDSALSLSLHKKMKFSIKDFFSKCDQIHRKLRIWSHLLAKSLMENFIFCVVFFQTSVIPRGLLPLQI